MSVISQPAIVLYVRHPTYWQAAACPRELPKNRRRTEVSVLYSGSPGAVGRHNNTPNRVAFGCVCHKHPPPSPVRALLVVRDPSPKGDSLAETPIFRGPCDHMAFLLW